MTVRKPLNVPYESWVDQQIRSAVEKGSFDNLPGAGKPLKDLDRRDPNWWINQKMKDETFDGILPPPLQLRKDVQQKLKALHKLPTEAKVREALAILNEQIRKVNATNMSGISSNIALLNLDNLVAEWRNRRR
ncbi:MAG: DUF1992 domain-containing protein [Rhodobacterales bacterium]|nr:DUF1992 domain-containing protein [Rhodobacterales bacterium]